MKIDDHHFEKTIHLRINWEKNWKIETVAKFLKLEFWKIIQKINTFF
jgi:hypothetical protein